jgi:hypothetical protein
VSTVTELEQRLSVAQQQLEEYARCVAHMRTVQRQRSPYENMSNTAARAAVEDDIDRRTAFHLIPEVPLFQPDLSALDGPPPADLVVPPVPDLVLDGLSLNGRGFRDPYFAVTLQDDSVVVRVDCNHNSISWIELTITEELIFKWQRQLAEADPEGAAELRGQFPEDDTPPPHRLSADLG